MTHISLRSTFAKLTQRFIINNALSQSGIYSSDVRMGQSKKFILTVYYIKSSKCKTY